MQAARAAVEQKAVFLLHQESLAEDAIELGYDIGSEFFEVLEELLAEAKSGHYVGGRPPQKSYKDDIDGLELFPFVVKSHRFGCRVYFKFAASEGSLWLVSLHQDRPREEST